MIRAIQTGSRRITANAWSDEAREKSLEARRAHAKLGTPPTPGHQITRTWLESMAKLRGMMARNPDLKYTSNDELILKEGKDFEPGPYPKGVHQGKMKLCYQNAFQLMQSNPKRYVYVEGVATTETLKQTGMAFDHAWVVDIKTGKVVDPTWKDGLGYRGIPLKEDFVLKTVLGKKTYGVLGNMTDHYPLLTGKVKLEDVIDRRV